MTSAAVSRQHHIAWPTPTWPGTAFTSPGTGAADPGAVDVLVDQRSDSRRRELGRPILPSGLSKIEQGDRRVDVDDLVALATRTGINGADLLVDGGYTVR